MTKKAHNEVIPTTFASTAVKPEEYLWRLAYADPITDLPNRAALVETLDALYGCHRDGFDAVALELPPYFRFASTDVLQSSASHDHISLLLVNVRRFKEVNDTYGLEVGDALLREIGKRLQAQLEPYELVARSANDEYAILLPGTSGAALPLAIEHVKMVFLEPFVVHDMNLSLEAHIGAAHAYSLDSFDGEGGKAVNLFQQASIALDFARQVETHSRIYDQSMGKQLRHRQNLLDRLKLAIQNDELELYYQPQFDLQSGELVGAEALCRWHDSELGQISPLEFIPLAEERGLIRALGDWVIQTAVAQLQKWNKQGLPYPGLLSINTSAHQFDTPYMVNYFLERTHAIPAEHIGIELTESVMVRNLDRSMKLLKRLREHGYHVAIDDFGTGFSSLSYLSQFPVSTLKIDQSFVQRMEKEQSYFALVQTIIAMAKALGLKTVAEGVENEEQYNLLVELGCDTMQGFLRGKPVSADEFAKRWLKK